MSIIIKRLEGTNIVSMFLTFSVENDKILIYDDELETVVRELTDILEEIREEKNNDGHN